jgi:hypothetical protein
VLNRAPDFPFAFAEDPNNTKAITGKEVLNTFLDGVARPACAMCLSKIHDKKYVTENPDKSWKVTSTFTRLKAKSV